jgi:hypothetical protein
MLESFMVVALALFSALALRSAVTSVLACMGFYVLSRMMAFFVMTSQSGMFNESKYLVLKWSLMAISTIVPRLDFFAKTEWLVYGFDASAEWHRFALQAAIFVPILIVASVLDFKRKQF